MISAYRFNYEHLPKEVKLNTFDAERGLIYNEIIRLLKDFEMSSSKHWFPIMNLLQRFKQIYSFLNEERQELAELILSKLGGLKSSVGLQNGFSLVCTIIQNKQKYLSLKVDWRYWHQYLQDKFMTNKDKTITSQTFSTQLFMQFCQFLKTVKYYFDADVVQFAFLKFREYLGYQDKQVAWAYLMLFVPFRTDIPQDAYKDLIKYLMDPLLIFGEKDNCRLKFILNYLRVYPQQMNLMPQMMRFFHGYWRNDLGQDDKNEKLVTMLLPDDTLGVPSLFKIMPQLLVELIGNSKREGYKEYMLNMKRLFSLVDSITSVYSQQTMDDQIFKLLKLMVGNFIQKYRRDQLLLRIYEMQQNKNYDENVSESLMQELIDQFNDVHIQDFIESDKYILELLLINPDQGYSSFQINYPNKRNSTKIHATKINIDKLLPFLLDEQAKQDFIEIVMDVLDKVIYMEDQGYSTAKTVLYLSCFEPKLIDFFLNKMKEAINDVTALQFITIKSILIFMAIPILQGKCPFSIHHLQEFMDLTYKLFEVQGVSENIDSLEFYCKIFMNVPIYTPEEYMELYGEHNELCRYLSEFVSEVFNLVIKNFNLIKYKDVDYGFVLPNLINIFWPYVANSSQRMLDSIVDRLKEHLENLEMQDLSAMGDLIDCILYRDSSLLEYIIDICMEKLLKQRQSPPKKHYLSFIVQLSKYSDYIQQFEPTSGNKQSKLLWLTLLEKSLTYAGKATQKHDMKIQAIVINYLMDEEDEVFTKVSDIIHSVIITNQIIKTNNLSWQNQRSQFFKKDFDQKTLYQPQDLEVEWILPTRQDWEYIFDWNRMFMFGVIEEFERTYMKEYEYYEMPRDFPKLIDLMIFRNPPMDPNLKQICYRVWFLVFGCFTGSSLFTPFQPQDLIQGSKGHLKLEKIQQDYLKRVCPPEYWDLRQRLGTFAINSICYAINNGVAHDKDINDLLVTIASECISSQTLNQELQLGREFMEGCRQLMQASQCKLYFESRIQCVIDINTYLYQRHVFMLHLQGIPIEYNHIYNYIIVLYLLGHSEFSSPQYLLPYSERATYTLTTGVRNNFFEYLLGILDYNNKDSRLSKINQLSERSKEYKQLIDLLQGFNSAVQHISSDIEMSMSIQKQLNQFISVMEYVDNQKCKYLIMESCVHHLAIQYDESTVVISNDYNDRLEMINNSIRALQSQYFWKCKIIHSLSLLNNINIIRYVPENCINAYRDLCINDHVTLNQLGRAGLFYFLRLAKQMIYKKQQVSSQQYEQHLPFNKFIQYRYLTQEQLSIIEKSYQSILELDDILKAQQPIYRSKMHEKYMFTKNDLTKVTIINDNITPFIKDLRQLFTDKKYMREFMEKILIDKDVAPTSEFDITDAPSQEVQFMSAQGITRYVQIFFTYIYGKNRNRQSPFSATQSFFMSDFYFRLFKKMFQVCGIAAFYSTKEVIDEYIEQFDQREKQRLVSCYLTALHRSLLNVGSYIQDSFIRILPNITQEIFYDYHLAFFYMCRDQDWQWISPVYLQMLQCCQNLIPQGGFKGLRYIQLLKILIQSQGPRVIQLQEQILQQFNSIIFTYPSSVYVEEYTCTLATTLLQTILIPIPIDAPYQDEHLIATTANFQIWYNSILQMFFKTFNEFLSNNSQRDKVKFHQELSARILEFIAISKFDNYSWKFIVEAMKIIFQNNQTDIDAQEILRKYIECDYDEITELLDIAEQMTKNDTWNIRKRANFFLRDWYFKAKLEGSLLNDIPKQLLNMFQDSNLQLQFQAVSSLADYLKLYTKQELEDLFRSAQENRVYILMSMLLSRQDRNFNWTDQALSEIFQELKNKRILQEFVSEYWKSRQDWQRVFKDEISEENVRKLQEIVNPHPYYA
ncbi:unnamed protein product (macronuclear) [Paramecium tetraurelia]|uniref:Uncharacterized protein n=1 Tax=Paramecium tetraurelia TaxID=5888 RepID=A0DRT4_PARTE|nr:uncharacterized protein GSPATT00019469001 [Paramecium tetraurelia]CAK85751.1 unnamed protein product [Paramecium tetraurelia]|eukprot:XP_001453148.1 hypothetical protein (macronuclear) [Paramecium tetraurelia strain d4-2]